jgi:hypothetical protein
MKKKLLKKQLIFTGKPKRGRPALKSLWNCHTCKNPLNEADLDVGPGMKKSDVRPKYTIDGFCTCQRCYSARPDTLPAAIRPRSDPSPWQENAVKALEDGRS